MGLRRNAYPRAAQNFSAVIGPLCRTALRLRNTEAASVIGSNGLGASSGWTGRSRVPTHHDVEQDGDRSTVQAIIDPALVP